MNTCNSQTDRYLFSKRGITLECICMTRSLADYPEIKECYDAAKEKFIYWLENERFSILVQAQGSQRGIHRLHIEPEVWSFSVTAYPFGKYLSVCLSVSGKGAVFEQTTIERRVWDTEKNILCPLTCFLPILQAKKYDKWEYCLEEQALTVLRGDKLHKIERTKIRKKRHNRKNK